jgi:hypothetical protein
VAGIIKLAALIGWTPDELANHLLAEHSKRSLTDTQAHSKGSWARSITLTDQAHNAHWIA